MTEHSPQEILTAKPTRLGRWFWTGFARLAIGIYFRDVLIPSAIVPDSNRSMLLIGNHVSWWDGFWPMYLNRLHFHKDFHAMMRETELRKRPFFRQTGAFSIAPGKRSVLKSLAYARKLLSESRNMVLIFPQGKIHSVYQEQFDFSSGIVRIIPPPQICQVVMMASFVDFGNKPRLSVRIYLEEIPSDKWPLDKPDLEKLYSGFYKRCKVRQLNQHLN